MCAVLRQPKSVKLRALHSECKFGVAARSCQELLHKGCVRFQLPVSGSRLCLYEDGTEVTDDFFPGLPNDAELLLLTAGQTWQGYVSDITRFLSVFNEPHAGVIRAARQLLSDERAPLRQKLLADLLHHVNQNITAETREQDPSWFEGLESRFRNKSGYLRYSCESRIRGYLREVSAHTSIEKKRTVVPTLAEAVQDGREVNWEYFYSLLFTAENLKLVHIACHKKTTHKLPCDRSRIYRSQAGPKRKRPARKRR
ncbi:DNA fragmentation factor subunit beta [Lemmus lemmus]